MDKKKIIKKERLRDAVDILNSIVFLAAAYSYWDQNNVWIAAALFFVGMINLIITEIFKRNRKLVKMVMMGFNSVVAGLIAYDYIIHHKNYIQYAWIAISLIYIFIFLRMLLKFNSGEKENVGKEQKV